MRLSPVTSYHIRKLLHRQSNSLQFVVVPGGALQADTLSDLNTVLESLYLEESEIRAAANKLETLTQSHQSLAQGGGIYKEETRKIEQEIFWLLGFKQVS